MPNIEEHITFRELKAVRCATQAFLPDLKGWHLLFHEDNQYVSGVLTHFASKSSTMMCELRKVFLLIVTYDIKIRTQYIRIDANVSVDNISCVTDNPTDSWLRASSYTSTNGGPPQSRPLFSPTPMSRCLATTPSGETVRHMQWKAYIYLTQNGGRSTIGASPLGSYSTTWS